MKVSDLNSWRNTPTKNEKSLIDYLHYSVPVVYDFLFFCETQTEILRKITLACIILAEWNPILSYQFWGAESKNRPCFARACHFLTKYDVLFIDYCFRQGEEFLYYALISKENVAMFS